jgi:two-component system chemotaxis response regulator CheB
MGNRDILALGASAGGLEALRLVASRLPPDLPAAVLTVIHLSAHFRSSLDAILTQAGPLPAAFAADGDRVQNGRIYIGPPERHLILEGERLRLGIGPRENHSRPAIDPLFRSVAVCCGSRAVGVVLTGTLGDGASGLGALKQCGGVAVVQDPEDAAFPEMPATAIEAARPHHVVGLAALPALLGRLAREPAGTPVPAPPGLQYEVEIARSGRSSMNSLDELGSRSVVACPDCHGVMWQIEDGGALRYRCHVGHAYAAELMSLALDEGLRRALGSALRALDERLYLAQRLERQARQTGRARSAETWALRAREVEQEAKVIRDSICRMDALAAHAAGDEED